MRSRILLVISAMLVLGVGIAVYSYNVSSTDAAAACCCCTESCPMKKGDKAATATVSPATADQKTEGMHSCCGDSCPMKGDKAADSKAEGHSCCGDSCPMKGKAAKHEGTNHEMKMDAASCPMMKGAKSDAPMKLDVKHQMTGDGHSCCCACCNKDKAEKKADASV